MNNFNSFKNAMNLQLNTVSKKKSFEGGKIEKEMEAFLNIKLSYFSLLEDEKRRGFPRTSTGRRSCANLQTLVREILQWVSTEYNTGLEWFPFSLSTTAFDWFRKLASPSQPI